MKLTLRASVSNEKEPDNLPLIIGQFQIDLPDKVSTAVAKSSHIASVIISAVNKIKEELQHGRS